MIGTDIIELEKVKHHSENKHFMNKAFTKNEMLYFKKKKNVAHIATTFAAKEAVFKAIGTGWLNGKEIEIIRNKKGKPSIVLYGYLKKLLKDKEVMVSLSYTKDYAVAFAVINKKRV